jgi:hypothetical protein
VLSNIQGVTRLERQEEEEEITFSSAGGITEIEVITLTKITHLP